MVSLWLYESIYIIILSIDKYIAILGTFYILFCENDLVICTNKCKWYGPFYNGLPTYPPLG